MAGELPRRFRRVIAVVLAPAAALAASLSPGAAAAQGQEVDFHRLLQAPDAREIGQVLRELSARNVFPDRVEVVATRRFPIAGHGFEARFIRHRVDGFVHCGVALVPRGAAPGSLAGVVDLPGVRWDFPTRNLSEWQDYGRRALGRYIPRFAVLAPCLRGSAVEAAGFRIEAEGDPQDAFDGAATDTVAFVHAAREVVPELDFSRLAVFGWSRGGAVALLAASRSRIFKAAVSFAGPMDFFREMNRSDAWADALRAAYVSGQAHSWEHQQLGFFVYGRDRLPLGALRARLVASSPLYFSERLPPVRIHQGREDRSVAAGNALRMREAFQRAHSTHLHQTIIHEGWGHDLLENAEAMTEAGAFLWRHIEASGAGTHAGASRTAARAEATAR